MADGIHAVLGASVHPATVDVRVPGSPSTTVTATRHVLRLGRVTINDLYCDVDVTARFGGLDSYLVALPCAGDLRWRQGTDSSRLATVGRAAVLQPAGDTVLERWSARCRLLAVRIDREAIEDGLEEVLGAAPPDPVRLGPELDTGRGRGRGWARLVRLLADDARATGHADGSGDGLAHHPLVAGWLQEALVAGLLLAAAPGQYTTAPRSVSQPVSRYAPRPVRRATEVMRDRPEHPFSTAELAEVAAVSVRSLQEAFQRHVGVPPMTYLRQLRLDRVHEELSRADPRRVTVRDVAYRWGFAHPGRFAAVYRERFGVSPARTLRDGTSARRTAR